MTTQPSAIQSSAQQATLQMTRSRLNVSIWMFPKIGVPPNHQWMIWGYPYFWKHPIYEQADFFHATQQMVTLSCGLIMTISTRLQPTETSLTTWTAPTRKKPKTDNIKCLSTKNEHLVSWPTENLGTIFAEHQVQGSKNGGWKCGGACNLRIAPYAWEFFGNILVILPTAP